MLRWIGLAVIIVVLVAGATFVSLNATIIEPTALPVAPAAAGPLPKLEIREPLTHEFGTMPQLTVGEHSWEFKNVGDADLVLWLEGSTCSCTVAKLKNADGIEKPKLVVKPRESTKIDVSWETRTFENDYNKWATIGTNDPSHPSVALNVHGKVYPPIIIVPDEPIVFDSASNEERHVTRIAVFSADRPETKITKVATSRPEFFVATPAPLTPEECKQLKVTSGFRVDVELKPGMPLGRFHEELVIGTDHPLKPEVKISITGSTIGPITVIPERLSMFGVSSAQGATRDMTVLVRGGDPTRFEVAHHPDKVDVKITPDDTPTQKGRYKLTVTVPPGTSAGPVNGDIVLKTNHPKASEIKVPVSILISKSSS